MDEECLGNRKKNRKVFVFLFRFSQISLSVTEELWLIKREGKKMSTEKKITTKYFLLILEYEWYDKY